MIAKGSGILGRHSTASRQALLTGAGVIVAAAAAALLLLRFFHLTADFPAGLNWSGDLYTDEGWWSRNAVAYCLTGSWYVPGDVNTAVTLPVMPALECIVFKLAGIGLWQARFLAAGLSVATACLLYALASRYANRRVALLATLFLAANYYTFTFGRMAFLETPVVFFVCATLLAVPEDMRRAAAPARAALAGLLFLAALLTKTSALFALPVILYLMLANAGSFRAALRPAAFFAAAAAGGYLAYWIALPSRYPQDFIALNTVWIAERARFGLGSFCGRALNALYCAHAVDLALFPVALISVAIAFFVKGARLFRIMGAWFISYLATMGIYGHFPPRYNLLWMPPLLVLPALLIDLCIQRRQVAAAVALLAVSSLSVCVNCAAIAGYMRAPARSFMAMADDVRRIIGEARSRCVLVNSADTVPLAAGALAVSADACDKSSILERYAPQYLLDRGGLPADAPVRRFRTLRPVKTYDVYGNYYTRGPVALYELLPEAGSE